ncbi:MAG: class I SAM-dependent methyltransferase [bacterium]|nr:MAG: class I SAM-dependent methyltransferase [bacterium]
MINSKRAPGNNARYRMEMGTGKVSKGPIEAGLSTREVKRFYDRFGARQDRQGFYENAAERDLVRHSNFREARSVLEFGCGTGRFAEELLARHLPSESRYVGIDISTTMVNLAEARLKPWREHIRIIRTTGAVDLDFPAESFDRFVSCYVLDILPGEGIVRILDEARRLLVSGGLICLISLTEGKTLLSRFVTGLWKRVYLVKPSLLGGCRPVILTEYLDPESWRVTHHRVVTAWGISSEVVVAEKT